MSLGYDRPLYLLPFDHRHSYLSGMFHFSPPLDAAERQAVIDSKRVIYDGFRQAVMSDVPRAYAGILADEEFATEVLRSAASHGYVTALSTEKSGCEEFELEYGTAFAEHIEMFHPTFAKALVRYNPEGDAALNRRQTAQLRLLSDYCRAAGQKFMFELLVPATDGQTARAARRSVSYELAIRPALMLQTIRLMQDSGIEPDIWKVEGLERREDCEQVVATARRGGRTGVGCIVLGHGADPGKVVRWLEIAASVPGFIGFAVGRTTFWNAIADWRAGSSTRADAVSRIAARYTAWADIFGRSRRSTTGTPLQGDLTNAQSRGLHLSGRAHDEPRS
jgi:myo-inositol catabolism protein IolC